MPFVKGHPRIPGSGRKKGSVNHTTKDLRECILGAFEELGGKKYLVRVGRKNPTVFVTLLARVLPTQINADIRTTNLDTWLIAVSPDIRDALTAPQDDGEDIRPTGELPGVREIGPT